MSIRMRSQVCLACDQCGFTSATEYDMTPNEVEARALRYGWQTTSASADGPHLCPVCVATREAAEQLAGVKEQREADPRLANLPEDLRKVAAEFLDLHQAWGTEFRPNNPARSMLTLHWGSLFEGGGRAMFLCEPCHDKKEGFVYKIVFDEGSTSIFTWEIRGPLRRSADFAEFVQRFKRAEVPA